MDDIVTWRNPASGAIFTEKSGHAISEAFLTNKKTLNDKKYKDAKSAANKEEKEKERKKSDIHDFVRGVGIHTYNVHVHICIYTIFFAYIQTFYS